MSFRRIKRRSNSEVFLELTPLIDVVFLLLIFFMVSTTFVDVNSGVNIQLPEGTVEEVVADTEVVISITDKKVVYIQDKIVRLNEFEYELGKILQAKNKTNVIIKGDKRLEGYNFVVDIMTKSKNAGANEIDIAIESEN